MPKWPTYSTNASYANYHFPQIPLHEGYKRTLPNNLIRSSMDAGSDKVRRRGRHKPELVTATYVLTATQLTALENFVHNSIAEGALAFDWPHPERGGYVKARIKAGGEGLFDLQPYKDTLHWQVTLNLEIWP